MWRTTSSTRSVRARGCAALAGTAVVALAVPAWPGASVAAPVQPAGKPAPQPGTQVVEPQDLGTLGGPGSVAVAVNDAGMVVGRSETADGSVHAFAWTAKTGMTDLGTLGGAHSGARDVSKGGLVVGSSVSATGEERAFVWTARDGLRDLGLLPGAQASRAVLVNDHDVVAGLSLYEDDVARPFLWSAKTGVRELDVPDWRVELVDLNNKDQLVGVYQPADWGPPRSFLWSAKTGAVDIGDLGAGYHTFARDLNDKGQVVGKSWVTGGGSLHAFRYDAATGRMTDLGGDDAASYCPNSDAVAINEKGQIAGERQDHDGDNWCRGLLWAPRSDVPAEFDIPVAVMSERGLVAGPGGEAATASWGRYGWVIFARYGTPQAWRAPAGPTIALGTSTGIVHDVNAHDQLVGSVTVDGAYVDIWGTWHGDRAHAALWTVPKH